MTKRMIVSDVGGTNGRFAIAEFSEKAERPEISNIQVYPCRDYPLFEDMLGTYLRGLKGDVPKVAQLAIAGEMTPRHGFLWHFNWDISAERLEQKFGLERITIMNDYEAMVRAVPYLTDQELFEIKPFKDGLEGAAYTVCGAGSGLGASIGKKSKAGLEVISTEAGHVSFGPNCALENDLFNYTKRTTGHVSNEIFLSGRGLKRIYDFVTSISDQSAEALTAPDITAAALGKSDNACCRTVDIFLDILASVTGDIALAQGARGGIYISGGIVPKLTSLIDKKNFEKRFNDKGPMSSYVEKIPVKIITSDMPGLLGAAMAID